MTDIVKRLDDMANGWLCAGLPDHELPAEAAREIQRLNAQRKELQSENERLKEELSRRKLRNN
jgi:hypothetical protein